MSEVTYSTIKDEDVGKYISVSVPFDPSKFKTEEDFALARAIHDEIQQRLREWHDGEINRQLLGSQ